MTLSNRRCQFLYKKKVGRTLLYEASPYEKLFFICFFGLFLFAFYQNQHNRSDYNRGNRRNGNNNRCTARFLFLVGIRALGSAFAYVGLRFVFAYVGIFL